jgi:hypothetical protein
VRQSQTWLETLPSGFQGEGREVPGFYRTAEILAFVGAVAERRIHRMAAAAQANDCPATKSEGLALLINNFEVALDAYRAVIHDRDFRRRQEILRERNVRKCEKRYFQDNDA